MAQNVGEDNRNKKAQWVTWLSVTGLAQNQKLRFSLCEKSSYDSTQSGSETWDVRKWDQSYRHTPLCLSRPSQFSHSDFLGLRIILLPPSSNAAPCPLFCLGLSQIFKKILKVVGFCPNMAQNVGEDNRNKKAPRVTWLSVTGLAQNQKLTLWEKLTASTQSGSGDLRCEKHKLSFRQTPLWLTTST